MLAVILAACGGQPATPNPTNAVSVTRTEGTATLARAISNSEGDLPDSALLGAGDHLYTAPGHTVTLQFSDGSTLQLGPSSHLMLYSIRPADRVAVFRLLSGSVTGNLRSGVFEVQAYKEVALNFRMVVLDLAAVLHGVTGSYQLGFDDNILRAIVSTGEFDIRSGNQQATLPAGWQAIAEPGKPLQIVSLITPTPAPPSAIEGPTATPIQIITIVPTNTPTETPIAAETETATLTRTPTRKPTIVQRTTVAATSTPTIVVNTPANPTGTMRRRRSRRCAPARTSIARSR